MLPPRFVRIRRYGLLSTPAGRAEAHARAWDRQRRGKGEVALQGVRGPLLERCRALIDAGSEAPAPRAPESRRDAAVRIFGLDPSLCPTCQKGRLVIRAEWGPTRAWLHTVLLTAFARAP